MADIGYKYFIYSAAQLRDRTNIENKCLITKLSLFNEISAVRNHCTIFCERRLYNG